MVQVGRALNCRVCGKGDQAPSLSGCPAVESQLRDNSSVAEVPTSVQEDRGSRELNRGFTGADCILFRD